MLTGGNRTRPAATPLRSPQPGMTVRTSANAARSRSGSACGTQPRISRTPPARAAARESSADTARGAPKPSPTATVIPGLMRSASLTSGEAKDALGDLGADNL